MISCGVTKHLSYCLIAISLSAFINGIHLTVRESTLNSIRKFANRVIRWRLFEERQISTQETELEKIRVLDIPANEKLNQFQTLWTSTYLVAAVIGALVSGQIADRYGRKKSLLWNNLLVFMAIFFIAFSFRFGSYEMILIGQFMFGAHSGINTSLATIYLTEVSPVRMRGIFGSVFIVSTSFAILVTNALITWFKLENWIYLFSSTLIPSVLMILVLNECPESPKYSYIMKGDQNRAQNELQRLRESSEINEELYEMKVENQIIERGPAFSYHSLLTDYKIRSALFISLVVVMSKHLTGMTAIQFIVEGVYQRAGLSPPTQTYLSSAFLAVKFTTSLVFGLMVEKLGRRTLLLVGLLGMFCCLVFVTFCLAVSDSLEVSNHLNIITLFLYTVLYSCGPSFIPHFYFAELFRTDWRSVGASISVAALYAIPLLISLCFSTLKVYQVLSNLNNNFTALSSF